MLENKLRGEKGGRVFIEDEKGKRLKRSKEAKEGENVTLTIDAAIQEKSLMR